MKWAEQELNRIEKDDEGMQEIVNQGILDVVRVFSEQGHSGFSARYSLNLIERLLAYKPITPLTGEDDEWNSLTEYGDTEKQQNKRCSSVFRVKQKDGSYFAYDIDDAIYTEDEGETWFSKNERYEISFPYTVPKEPERIYLKVKEDTQ